MASGPFEFVQRAARDYLDEADRRDACDCCPHTVIAMALRVPHPHARTFGAFRQEIVLEAEDVGRRRGGPVRISLVSVCAAVHRGCLRATKVGRRYVFDAAEVIAVVSASQTP